MEKLGRNGTGCNLIFQEKFNKTDTAKNQSVVNAALAENFRKIIIKKSPFRMLPASNKYDFNKYHVLKYF